MDGQRFDALARAVASAAGSRRSALRRLAGVALASVVIGGDVIPGDAKDKTDKGGNGRGNDGGDKGDKGPACRDAGHPCEGNQVCCQGLVCSASGPGAAKRCTAQATGANRQGGEVGAGNVAQTAAFQVQVACTYAAAVDQTTCTCTGVGGAGAPPVRQVTVPLAVVCGDVVGGVFRFATQSAGSQVPGYVSTGDQGTVSLVLAGRVTTAGTATYWCTTASGAAPATGPRLVTQPGQAASTTGAISVQANVCAIATPTAGFDWHGQCARPAAGVAFSLARWNGAQFVPTKNGTTTADGRLGFARLQPGTYQLRETSGVWCHAESDSVDAKGQVIVKAGQSATVWVFNCAAGS